MWLAAAAAAAQGATLPSGFSESVVASGLANPTAMEFAPDGRLFVCQQAGALRVIKNGALLPTPFTTLSVNSSGERGLLGIAFDPNFAANHYVYVYYTTSTSPIHNRVSRVTANGDVALAGSETVIMDLENLSSATNHNGGAIHFGPDGALYVGVGENATSSNAQTLANRLGKLLRINPDGSIPLDNPFYNTASGVNRSIWALGLRNPFTFAFQPGTGRMFINDVGANLFEEINDGIAGSNYGWPNTEGYTTNPTYRSPVFAYGHGNSPTTGCAIVGAAFYNPQTVAFPADYIGKYFFADLCSGWIRRFDPVTGAVTGFASGISSPVDLRTGTDGRLYYLARGAGAVYAVTFGGGNTPAAVSVTPSSGSGSSQTFSYLFSDLDGYPDLLWTQLLVNGTLSGTAGCYLHYDRGANAVYLFSDAGPAWLGPLTLGTAGSIQNSQCTVSGAGSSASGSGSSLTLNVALSFTAAFAGTKNVYMLAQDTGGRSTGWQMRGTWTVPGAGNQAPVAVSATPSSGSGSSQVFSFLFTDANGYGNLSWAQVLVNSTLSGTAGCYVHFDRAANAVYLYTDAGPAWLGPLTLGAAGSLQNSQCTVNGTGSSASGSGNNLTVNLSLNFQVAFAGVKNIYMLAQDTGGLSTGWQVKGTWTVPGAGNQAPSAVSVTPSSGSGSGQVFSFLFSDANGFGDMPWAQLLVNSTLSGVGGCYIHFDRGANAVYLYTDAGPGWLGPLSLGGAGSLQNSQCIVNGTGSSASGSGNNLTVNLSLSFKAAFAGAKNVYMLAQDTGGLSTGWQAKGTWTVP